MWARVKASFYKATQAGLGLWTHLPKPVKWLPLVIATALTGWMNDSVERFVRENLPDYSGLKCSLTESQIVTNPNLFTVIVAHIQGDSDWQNTTKVIQTFRGTRGFQVWRTCATITIPEGLELSKGEEIAISRGREMLAKHNADLLIWGEVVKSGESLRLWAINDHGECTITPKPFLLDRGVIEDRFSMEMRSRLVATSLSTITAACLDRGGDPDRLKARTLKLDQLVEDGLSEFRLTDQAEILEDLAVAHLLLGNKTNSSHYKRAEVLAENATELYRRLEMKPELAQVEFTLCWIFKNWASIFEPSSDRLDLLRAAREHASKSFEIYLGLAGTSEWFEAVERQPGSEVSSRWEASRSLVNKTVVNAWLIREGNSISDILTAFRQDFPKLHTEYFENDFKDYAYVIGSTISETVEASRDEALLNKAMQLIDYSGNDNLTRIKSAFADAWYYQRKMTLSKSLYSISHDDERLHAAERCAEAMLKDLRKAIHESQDPQATFTVVNTLAYNAVEVAALSRSGSLARAALDELTWALERARAQSEPSDEDVAEIQDSVGYAMLVVARAEHDAKILGEAIHNLRDAVRVFPSEESIGNHLAEAEAEMLKSSR